MCISVFAGGDHQLKGLPLGQTAASCVKYFIRVHQRWILSEGVPVNLTVLGKEEEAVDEVYVACDNVIGSERLSVERTRPLRAVAQLAIRVECEAAVCVREGLFGLAYA